MKIRWWSRRWGEPLPAREVQVLDRRWEALQEGCIFLPCPLDKQQHALKAQERAQVQIWEGGKWVSERASKEHDGRRAGGDGTGGRARTALQRNARQVCERVLIHCHKSRICAIGAREGARTPPALVVHQLKPTSAKHLAC